MAVKIHKSSKRGQTAGKKAWATRLATHGKRELAKSFSDAAKKAWATRRANAKNAEKGGA